MCSAIEIFSFQLLYCVYAFIFISCLFGRKIKRKIIFHFRVHYFVPTITFLGENFKIYFPLYRYYKKTMVRCFNIN